MLLMIMIKNIKLVDVNQFKCVNIIDPIALQ